MLTREELINLFDRFSTLTCQSDVKKRIADAVTDNQEAVAVTTAIQEEILMEMGLDPAYGLSCLGKINTEYEHDHDLMVRFYGFVAKEEMACEEAELGPEKYSERLQMQHNLHQQQLEMLKQMRKYGVDHQVAILDKLRQQMGKEDFENEASLLSVDEMEEIVQNKA